MSEETRVELTVADGVARLCLARPEAHNGIDMAMAASLEEAVVACRERSDVRAVLICADGPSFTVGGDLRHLRGELDRLPEQLEEMIGRYHVALEGLWEMDAPVVCAAQGPAAGGGLGLMWCADFVLAADDLKIATGFARIGLSGDGGSSWHLPRLVGLRRAKELIMQGRMLTAAEALEWGLVNRIVAVGDLRAEAESLARELAAGATVALAEQRRLLGGSFTATYAEQLVAERTAMGRTGATEDAQEGLTSFNDKRPPRFAGR